jgi:Mg-chelatase subunit ChlD
LGLVSVLARAILALLTTALVAGGATLPRTVHAQDACLSETEPNHPEVEAPSASGVLCVTGDLPADDQDFILWERPASGPRQPWTLRLAGAPAILTILEGYEVASEAGTPILAGRSLVELAYGPDAFEPAVAADLLLPDRLLLGIARSALPDGTEPGDTGYTVEVVAGTALPAVADAEPNDDDETATVAESAFALSGDLAGSDDHVAWTVPEETPPDGWRLEARAILGTPLRMSLRDASGRQLASTTADDRGIASFRDLRPAAGRLSITLSGGPLEGESPYVFAASPDEGPGDAEPNDDWDLATPLAPGTPETGRLTGPADVDLYRLAPEPGVASRLIDVRLIWRTDADRSLCLTTLDRRNLQCRRGNEGLVLRDLLVPGDVLVSVSGPPEPDDPYVLRVDATTLPSPGWETEPNDDPETANPIPADGVMQGSGGAEDADVLATTADGDPQLWRVDVTGTGLDRVEWIRADGTTMGSAEVAADGTSARLVDLFFIPGQRQHLRVRARSGDYRLALEPFGPPDPNGEREPNDGLAFNETLPVGVARTGRLATSTDVDEFRFTTAATDHVVLHAEAPEDGDLDLRLYDDAGLGVTHVLEPGAVRDIDLLLPIGDYRIVMVSRAPGEGPYALRLDRTDPFVVAHDQEPNDSPGWAGALEGDGRVVGSGRPEGDLDWYRLPIVESPTPITVVAADGVDDIELLTDATTALPIELDEDGVTYRSGPLQPGVEHFLRVRSSGDHAFTLEGLPGPATAPAPSSDQAGPALSAELADTRVAAFWPSAQRVSGTLRLEGADASAGPWALEGTTSDRRWTVSVPNETVAETATGSVETPFEVLVPRDASADVPVRVSFRARPADGAVAAVGAPVTASVELIPDREAPPLGPHRAWSVPAALLGGLDVASPWLGATLLPSVDPVGEAALHDGFAPTDGGLVGPIAGLPLELTVDLAGDEPVQVAGTILNALSGDPSFGDSPARFELELSPDGGTWTRVLSGRLERSIRDQAFVLDEPVDARFARLRMLSTHREGALRISLGEWKVVAVPGTPSPVEPHDLAEPVLGGHVAWTEPQLNRIEQAQAMIDEDPATLEPVPIEPRDRLTWAVGFHEGRAARIAAIEWSDPPVSDPTTRIDELEVATSQDGPLGPWRPLGTWQLVRSPDGSVAPFVLDAPEWARYVRFRSDPASRDARWIELPGAMRIREVETSDGYRSILGQWGLGERSGPLEADGADGAGAGIAVDPDDDTLAQPRPLELDTEASGRVHHDVDTDWHAVSVPRGQRTLHALVGGEPYVGVELVLRDADGSEVPMTFEPGERPGSVLYSASVEPGAQYLLEVRQPASSVVVTFDTSASVGPYLDAILGSLRGFGADVVPGRERVRILPFDGEPLLPGWNDQPFEIQAAAASYVLSESSSGAEDNLAKATRDLAPQRGARAVLIVTDAASSTYGSTSDLWRELGAVRPLVFAVQTGGINEAPSWQRHHLMADWAASAGGVYRYAHSRADIEDAFDHLATWLRRPASYRMTVTTSPDELPPPEPGRLSVAAPDDGSGQDRIVLAGDVVVELILDTSGSMLESIGGERRIDVAKRVLVDLLSTDLPAGLPVALRVFDDRPRCASELAVPLGSLDPPSMIATILERRIPRRAPTPLAAAIEQVADDLAGAAGRRVVVILSDGRESCDGDPEAAVRALVEAGIDVRLNIIGFGLERRQDRRAMARLAELGNGAYFDARRADDLAAALTAAVSAQYRVIDASGAVVAEGAVGGDPVAIETGTYAVEVDVEPVVRYDEVYVAPGGDVALTLPVVEEPAEAAAGEP